MLTGSYVVIGLVFLFAVVLAVHLSVIYIRYRHLGVEGCLAVFGYDYILMVHLGWRRRYVREMKGYLRNAERAYKTLDAIEIDDILCKAEEMKGYLFCGVGEVRYRDLLDSLPALGGVGDVKDGVL